MTMRLSLLLACAAALSAPALGAEGPYSISAPGTALTGYVAGASLVVSVVAPADKHAERITLRLNGADVTSALHPDASGALSGTVAGLQPGANTLELFDKKKSVASLNVMRAMGPAMSCESLATLAGFPIQAAGNVGGTKITAARLVPAVTTGNNQTPEYCLVQGMLQERIGVAGIAGTTSYTDKQPYGTLFEVRLPTAWNGRYMFQGGGGTEGGQPNASGQPGGTSGLAVLKSGFVVAAQNGGHLTSQLPPTYPAGSTTTDLNHIQIIQQNMFFSDPQAVKDWGYNSIDVTTQTTKYLIDAYYGRPPERSYFVGCSTSGRQGMAMSQLFPQHYDGIVAGDPFYLPPDISLSETWGLEQIISVSPIVNGVPQYLQSFTLSDQNLFTNAILAACDHLDGLVDGIIDNAAACKFDPASFVFPSTGVYGSIAPGMPLQCTGAKTASCLTPAQVTATKKIDQGPRTSSGSVITSPDGTPLSGYPFDGGFMQPSGIPTRDIGTATSPPGNIGLGSGQLPLFWFATPDPTYNPLTVNYDTDMHLVTPASPAVNNSTDIKPFLKRGGKLIFYHGLSDSGPPWPYTLKYFRDVAKRHGGVKHSGDYMKLYLVPNMGHCSGNMATDQFDMLTPMVNWIENGVAPQEIIATGNRFPATVGPYTGFSNTTRSRPLCAYPNTLRYRGAGDIAQAASYVCVAPDGKHDEDDDHDD